MNFSIISAECELACLDIRREYEILVIILQYTRLGGSSHNKIFLSVFRKHFTLPWTAIWPMTKNSSGSWQSPQLRDVMSAPGNLLHWLDLSFWSSLYFISSWAAAWILIFSGDQFFVLSGFLIGFQAESSLVQLVSWLWLPPRLQAETLTRNILQLRPMSKWNIPTMPITTKQDIFNETRFIFVTDITTSDLLQWNVSLKFLRAESGVLSLPDRPTSRPY